MSLSHFQRIHRRNVSTLRSSPLAEISGALGDLGTLLPLMIALAVQHSISLSTTLVLSGVWNILTGVVFGIPLPVQPMKAIAAVAISRQFSITETTSAGFFVAGAVLLFSVTGLLRWFTRVIPIPVVKGIQVGAGLSLVSSGVGLLNPLTWVHPSWADNRLWALFAVLTLLITHNYPRVPYALLIFLLGLIFAIILTTAHTLPAFEFWSPGFYIPSGEDFETGFWNAGLGQLPLTTLNSVVAVSFLSADLLPDVPAPTVTSLGVSVAIMNIVGGWFGAMPVCHGSGGLAAQYRFGARSGASIIILGLFKVLLGLIFGETLVSLLGHYPKSLLGVMVFGAGLELTRVGESLNNGARDLWEASEENHEAVLSEPRSSRMPSEEERRQRWMVMMMTIVTLLFFHNDAIGFIAGMLCHWSYQWQPAVEGIKARFTSTTNRLRHRHGDSESEPLLSRD